VLVVDDDKQIEVAVRRVFDRAGYRTSGAENAEEALNLMDQAKFDLVIADIVMDGMDGVGLLGEIKKRDKALPVVLVTAYSNEEYEERGGPVVKVPMRTCESPFPGVRCCPSPARRWQRRETSLCPSRALDSPNFSCRALARPVPLFGTVFAS